MSSGSTSVPLGTTNIQPGETHITTTTTETSYLVSEIGTISMQSSGDYPTNPTTEHRYGANIGTGIYDPNIHNAARTSYTIRQSDIDRTAPSSGKGIHARQYHGRELGSVPIGSTTIIHQESDVSREMDHDTYTRIFKCPERHLGGGHRHVEGQVPHESDYIHEVLEDSEAREGMIEVRQRHPGPSHLQTGDLQHKREMAIAAERERITQERIDTRKGSIHGVFGHGRHRDAPIVGRDTDAADFGNKTAGKIDAHRDVRSTTGSEHDRLIGTISGRERLAREQEARYNCMLASQSSAGDPTRHRADTETVERHIVPEATGTAWDRTATSTSAPYATERSAIPEGGKHSGYASGAAAKTDASQSRGPPGHVLQEEKLKDEKHAKGKPSMIDKIIGNTKAAIGKTTHNPAMTAKGEERASGLSRN